MASDGISDTAMLPKLRKSVPESGDLRLDWGWQPLVADKFLFLSVHRSGTINIFDRNPENGELAFLGAISLASDLGSPGKHIDPYMAFADGILYVSGQWTHARGDQDSIGLSWYRIENDGKAKKLGHIPSIAGVLHKSPTGKLLLLAGSFSDKIQEISIGPDGTASVVGEVSGKDSGKSLVFSPNGKFCYSMGDTDLSIFSCGKDGLLSRTSSLKLPDPPEGKKSDHCLCIPPDCRHIYVFIRYMDQKKAKCAGWIFKLDQESGMPAFVERSDIPELAGIREAVFLPDGKAAYYCGEAFNICGLGYLIRDTETGKLSFGAKASGSNPSFHFAYDKRSGTIYLGGHYAPKQFKIFDAAKFADTP